LRCRFSGLAFMSDAERAASSVACAMGAFSLRTRPACRYTGISCCALRHCLDMFCPALVLFSMVLPGLLETGMFLTRLRYCSPRDEPALFWSGYRAVQPYSSAHGLTVCIRCVGARYGLCLGLPVPVSCWLPPACWCLHACAGYDAIWYCLILRLPTSARDLLLSIVFTCRCCACLPGCRCHACCYL